jgi:hypothetical protein
MGDFECFNCGKRKPDSEKGSLPTVMKVGFFWVWTWPSVVCKQCETQVGLICMGGLFFLAVFLVAGISFLVGL